jgi:beta-mannosidase
MNRTQVRRAVVKLFLAAAIAFPSASPLLAQDPLKLVPIAKTTETLLSGPDWRLGSYVMDTGEQQKAFLSSFDDREFSRVSVPGEVQRQIGLTGMDLYYQSKQLTLVNEKEWWYRKRFVAPKSDAGKLLRLQFDGVDYFSTVWLNGEKLGQHEGAYTSFSFDVSGKLKYGADNLLVVKVTCPWVPSGRGFLEYLKGEWTLVAPRHVVRMSSPPYILGPYWDGIPAFGNAAFPMGLFRDVKLIASGATTIDDLFVATKSLNADGTATLEISGTVSNHSDRDVSAELDLKISPDNFAGPTVTLPQDHVSAHPGETHFRREVQLKDAHLWWTWDLGAQDLYKLTAAISLPESHHADARTAVFGIRTIVRHDDMSYWLNGKRLFLKGAWYPMSDYYGSKPTHETYVKDLEMYKAANLNHLVAFTVVEKPEFYDLCDRMGILEMFEFPFEQFGPIEVLAYTNPRREIFVKQSLDQLRQIVIQLRDHPSIIVWGAFAEARVKGVGWGNGDEDWGKFGYEEYSQQIEKLVEELAPGTVYHPSFCDVGEQHFWMANAGMGISGGYQEQFNANAGFVSEYGGIALPSLQTLQKILTPDELWSDRPSTLPRWFNLPIDVRSYSYQTSFEYKGLYSVLHRANEFVDRHVKSAQELIDDSQLYQAFMFKYSTESYRRKKYDSINGTRIWAYGEVTPGIRFNFIDYDRVPKMGYYYLKNAQARLAVNFAYEKALESQVSGTRLQIPVWAVNDYRRDIPLTLHCEILDVKGRTIWSQDSDAVAGDDSSKQVSLVDWTTPDQPGVYILRARAVEKGGEKLEAQNTTFIKVTPRLFSRAVRMLLIGERKFDLPIAEMAKAAGVQVDVIDEESLPRFAELKNVASIRAHYDVVWLASFDSLWKLMNDGMADGLRQAIHDGVGFIHTGGEGSFHGGYGRAAMIDVRPLAEALPVRLSSRSDVTLGPLTVDAIQPGFEPFKTIGVTDPAAGWGDMGFATYGIPGFNDVDTRPESRELLTISGRPLLVSGDYGRGHTVAFTGYTPAYPLKKAFWDSKVTFPYCLDQEFVTDPVTRSYFTLFVRMIALASGQKPEIAFDDLLAARDKPLFESLKDLPKTSLKLPAMVATTSAEGKSHAILKIASSGDYARLVRVRAEWPVPNATAPYLVKYSDNYFDLLPGEEKSLDLEMFLPAGHGGKVAGTLIVEGPNITAQRIPIELQIH